MRLLLAGGGSGGSATPVLAIAAVVRARAPNAQLLYVGTRGGPEADLAAEEGIRYVGVAAGKLRRYWSAENVRDVFGVGVGIGESARIVRRFRPDAALGAGGFASVPPLAAAATLGVPVLVHQQDVVPGLANRLLTPFARRITVAMAPTLRHFPASRATLRGNPVRPRILTAEPARALKAFDLDPSLPLLLATGGGTGALALNRIVAEATPELVRFCQVLHLTGRGRGVVVPDLGPRYLQREFLTDLMPHALAAATLVISRAGMATLTELAALGKAAIVVPMPRSHQEANAVAFAAQKAAVTIDEATLSPTRLVELVRGLLGDDDRRARLQAAMASAMPRDAADRIADDLLGLLDDDLD